MCDEIFHDIDEIDWAKLGDRETPVWIRGLASDDPAIRHNSFYRILWSHSLEYPDFASFVVIYVLRILEQQEVNNKTNEETEVLITFLKNQRYDAFCRRTQGTETKYSANIISEVDNSIELFKTLQKHPLASEAAQELIYDIENPQL